MDYTSIMESAFLDELEKISAAKGKLRRASNARKGRRPLRVSTMLKKEKDGTLFKYTKQAEVEAIPALLGLAAGYRPGRNVAGETAAALSPRGRVTRGENIARQAAIIGAPLGGLGAMALARRYGAVPRLLNALGQHFPKGLIADPHVERQIVEIISPFVLGVGGSALGGLATGAGTGLVQQLRGPLYAEKQAGEGSGGNVVPYSNSDYQSSTGASGPTGSPARGQPGPNDIVTSREDGREAMSTKIPAFARISLAPAAVNTPEEHGNF